MAQESVRLAGLVPSYIEGITNGRAMGCKYGSCASNCKEFQDRGGHPVNRVVVNANIIQCTLYRTGAKICENIIDYCTTATQCTTSELALSVGSGFSWPNISSATLYDFVALDRRRSVAHTDSESWNPFRGIRVGQAKHPGPGTMSSRESAEWSTERLKIAAENGMGESCGSSL